MGQTKIEWTQKTWNPVTGCTKVSHGCKNCYAERMSKRLAGRCGYPADEPFRVTLHPDRLEEPLRWKKPTTIFVCSMGDLFHKDVPFEFIDQVFAVMALCQQHTFQVLTKRPERMLAYLTGHAAGGRHIWEAGQAIRMPNGRHKPAAGWPLPNVWLGTSCEDQEAADKRIHYLLQVPAAVRFLSCEPLLGPVDLTRIRQGNAGGYEDVLGDGEWMGEWPEDRPPGIDWVITGGESGPGARPVHPEWIRSLRDQCHAAGVSFFFKQWGEWLPGQNGPHPLQKWGLAHHQDGSWGRRTKKLPRNPEKNYVVWYADGTVQYGDQTKAMAGRSFRERAVWAERVGKKTAGRLLDGVLWDQMPEVPTP